MDITVKNHPITPQYMCFHNTSNNFITGSNPPYHQHDAYEIYLFIRGNVRMYIEHTCYLLRPGDLIIINPDEFHRSICLDSTTYERVAINIKESLLCSLSTEETDLRSCFHSHLHGTDNLIHLSDQQKDNFVKLVDNHNKCNTTSNFGNDLLKLTYLLQLLIFTNHSFINSERQFIDNLMPNIIVDCMNYITNNISKPISLSDLSAQFNFNGNYLSHLFKKHTGLNLRDYIVQNRLQIAKKELLMGASVTEACYRSGFNDYSNFIRTFTKLVGISPGRYKKNCPKNIE